MTQECEAESLEKGAGVRVKVAHVHLLPLIFFDFLSFTCFHHPGFEGTDGVVPVHEPFHFFRKTFKRLL